MRHWSGALPAMSGHVLRQLVGIAAGLCRHWLQVMQYGVDARQAGEGIGTEAHDGPRVWVTNKSSGGFETWSGRPIAVGGDLADGQLVGIRHRDPQMGKDQLGEALRL